MASYGGVVAPLSLFLPSPLPFLLLQLLFSLPPSLASSLGYRHIHLTYAGYRDDRIGNATLFVHVQIQDYVAHKVRERERREREKERGGGK